MSNNLICCNCYYEKIGNSNTKLNLPIIPNNWTWVRLLTISNKIQYGLGYPSAKEGNNKYLRITDIQNNKVDWTSVPFINIKEDEQQYLLENNDIVFARTGATVGKSYLVFNPPKNATFASYLIRVELTNKKIAKYINYFFKSKQYWNQIIDKSVGSGQPNCNGTKLSSLLIPIPPIKELCNIVDRLDNMLPKIDNIISEKDNLNNIIDKIKVKILDFYFGDDSCYKSYYKKVPLYSVCKLEKKDISNNGLLPYLEAKVIRGTKNPIFKNEGMFITKGTLIILVDGENSGEVMVVPFNGYMGSTFRILHFNNDVINQDYLSFFILYNKQNLKDNKTGSAIPHLNKKIFNSLSLILPDINKQKSIVHKISLIFDILDKLI